MNQWFALMLDGMNDEQKDLAQVVRLALTEQIENVQQQGLLIRQ
ncbi:hypothetical protein [Mycoavidus sp. SF9855]|nr:hypothetical protein [Mycoavidus sp. SF9855]UUM20819.1 hypothetical protein NQD60_04875 [Mycoavidus sp. SF9855]